MNEFIKNFIEGFMAGLKRSKSAEKPTENVGTSTAGVRQKVGEQFAKWGRNYKQFGEDGVLNTALGVVAHPVGKGSIAAAKLIAAPSVGGQWVWKKGYPFWGAVAGGLGYGALGALGTAGINNYALADFNNTAGVDMNQLAKYGQARDFYKPVNGVKVDPAAFNERVVQNQQGIPMVYRFPLGNTEDVLKSAWDWVEYVEPRAANYAQYREAVKNLVAPGWGQGREGRWPIGDYYENNPNLPQHINDAKKLYKYTRDMASLAENGDLTSQEIISLLKSGKEVTPNQRDYLITYMQDAAKRNDFNEDKNVIISAFNSKGANYWLQANGITPVTTNSSNVGLGNEDNKGNNSPSNRYAKYYDK